MIRIWLNHWFSTAYNLIDEIKREDKDNDFYFIGTNKRSEAVYKLICDEFYEEPEITGSLYIDWCLEFCKKHNVDVFFPRLHREEIAENYEKFCEIGVKVLIDSNTKLVNILEDKIKTAELFKKYNICKVPEMIIVNNVVEFMDKYKYLKEKYPDDRICFKYAVDEGATSFRVIDDVVDDISILRQGKGLKISYMEAVKLLGSVENFDDLILMPYLKGPEISIDSLMTSKGFVGCSRIKSGTREMIIDTHSELIDISKRFAMITGLKCPYNLQLRWHNHELYLLEVNTRMAGGTHKSYLAGINFPYLALCDLIGKDFSLPEKTKDITVTEIETPLILKEKGI